RNVDSACAPRSNRLVRCKNAVRRLKATVAVEAHEHGISAAAHAQRVGRMYLQSDDTDVAPGEWDRRDRVARTGAAGVNQLEWTVRINGQGGERISTAERGDLRAIAPHDFAPCRIGTEGEANLLRIVRNR